MHGQTRAHMPIYGVQYTATIFLWQFGVEFGLGNILKNRNYQAKTQPKHDIVQINLFYYGKRYVNVLTEPKHL